MPCGKAGFIGLGTQQCTSVAMLILEVPQSVQNQLLSISNWGVFHSQCRHSSNCTATGKCFSSSMSLYGYRSKAEGAGLECPLKEVVSGEGSNSPAHFIPMVK